MNLTLVIHTEGVIEVIQLVGRVHDFQLLVKLMGFITVALLHENPGLELQGAFVLWVHGECIVTTLHSLFKLHETAVGFTSPVPGFHIEGVYVQESFYVGNGLFIVFLCQ